MCSSLLVRSVLALLPLMLLACGDPTVSYWKKVSTINEEYSEQSDELVKRLLQLKKSPNLPGLASSSEQAASILKERDEELEELNTENVDPDVVSYVTADRKTFSKGREVAEQYQHYFEQFIQGNSGVDPDPSRVASQIGRGRQEIRKIMTEARQLEQQAEALRKEKAALYEKDLPPLHFRLPEIKALLSPRS